MKKPTLLAVTLFALAIPVHPSTAAKPAPAPSPDPAAPTADSNNIFSVDLYQRLKGEPGNLFFSSYSISSALAMAYAGADGETAAQMQKVLHLLGGDAAHSGYAALNSSLANAQNGNVEMNVANALWPQAKFTLLDSFLKTTSTHYGATLTPVDFSDPDAAAAVINRWVDEQTRGKIKDIIPASAITPATRLILTNAIYFKGDWANAFDEKRTRDLPFHAAAGPTAPVAMMSQKDKFAYAAADGLQILEMPYLSGGAPAGSDAAKRITELEKLIAEKQDFMRRARMTQEAYRAAMAEIRAWQTELAALKKEHGDGTDRLSMVILLPEAKDGLPALEEKLTADNLAAWIASTRKQKVQVTIPKWKLETKFTLSDTLKSLGMPDAFSPSAADFSNLTSDAKLFISDVLHKAFVEVNEKGTEAAAATGIVMGVTSAAVPKPDPVFTADHPFLFLIRDQKTGAILFMGRLADPS